MRKQFRWNVILGVTSTVLGAVYLYEGLTGPRTLYTIFGVCWVALAVMRAFAAVRARTKKEEKL